MAEFNYLREKRRMLDSLGRTGGVCGGADCFKCPLYSGINCALFEMEMPDEATAIVRK